jgi:flagellar assembly factor FliW
MDQVEGPMTDEAVLLTFPEGLAGYPDNRVFRLFEPPDAYPLKFLQSEEDPSLSFTCMDAAAVKVDYTVPLSGEDALQLALATPEAALVLVLVVVPEDPRQMTANLAGPLVVNTATRTGRQVVLDSRVFPLQYPVMTRREDVEIQFPDGLIGFPGLTTYRLFEPPGGYPLKFLQSVQREDVSFTCIDVAAIQNDYQVSLGTEDAEALALERLVDAMVLALVSIPEDPRRMTANLAGPVVINTATLQGRQLVLNTDVFPLKHRILAEP